ncbi:HVO_A0114 family putative DNA-binding protein [Halostella salina]|uniref:HVO_A0114 family putative DNA-binding protein n=1 Tax=Halostella salina TaxID=1547897 RepID=UPI000EF7830F|nr:helix-turn-helix domain-containing protein [Halostella salina]
MTENTLRITFGEEEEIKQAARERLRRAEAGEVDETIEQDVRFVLNFETYEDIERLMRPSTLGIIETIVTERPASIRDVAEEVERDYREVHRNLRELEELGVVEFEETGQRKRPILRAGTEEIEFSFRFPRSSVSPTGASA